MDDAGNFYESSQSGGEVAEIPANGGATANFAAFLGSRGLALDASGDFYLVDDVGSQLIKDHRTTLVSGGPTFLYTIYNDFYQPNGVAMGNDGTLYVADKGNNEIKQVRLSGGYYLSPSLPAGLVFDNITGIITGTPTVATPSTNYTVTAYNAAGSTKTTFSIATAIPAVITTGAVTGTITACVGNASASPGIQQFTVSGTGLTADITVTAPAGFEVSAALANNFNSTITLAQVNGVVSSTIVYVRSAATALVGNISGNVVLSSTGVTSQNIAVTGTINPTPLVNGVPNQVVANGTQVVVPAFTGTAGTYSWVNDNPGIGLPTSGTGNIPSFTPPNSNNSLIARITVTPSSAAGCSGISFTFTIIVEPVPPTITVTPVTGTISACLGDASANRSTQQFTISGNNLTDNIAITAPPNFEMSTNATNNYSSAFVLSEVAGLVQSTVIYVRSSPTAPAGNVSGNVVISSTGVTTQNVAVSGTVSAPPVINGLPDQIVADGSQVVVPPFNIPGATQVTWTNGNTAIGLAASGAGDIPSFTATNTGNVSTSSIITVTATSPTCAIVTKDFKVTVAPAFSLPDDNFKLAITSATCKGNNDGSINITSAINYNNYLATINGHGISASYQFTASVGINNLAADTYHICITVQGYPEYLQCYDLVVSEPKDLSVYSVINSDNSLTLALSGGTQYNIQLNGQTYTTTDNSITLPMAAGNNDLTVTTDRLCQGSYNRLINISGNILPYPDPFQNTLSFNIGNAAVNNVNVEIHNVADGKLVFTKQYVNQSGVLELDLTNLQGGVYALHLSMDNTEKIYKIVKK